MTSGNRFSVEGLEPRRLLSQTFENGNDNDIVRDAAGTEHLAFRNVTPTPPNSTPVNDTLWYASRPSGGTWSAATPIDLGVGADGTRGTLDDVYVGEFVSINVDANNLPGVAYYDATNADLKYAKFNGTAWDVRTADAHGVTGLYPSLVFNNSARPHIAYYKSKVGSTLIQDLRVAVLEPTDWVITEVDKTGDVGRYPSIAIQKSSGRWGVAYQNTTNEKFRYARQTSGIPVAVDVDDTVTVAGGFTSLAFDPDDNIPTFSYYGAQNSELKFARATDVNGAGWSKSTIAGSPGNAGKYNNLWYRDDGTGQHRARVTYYNQSVQSIYLLDETSTPGAFGTPSLVFSGGGFEHEAVPVSDVDFTYTWVDYTNGTNLYVNDTKTGKNWTQASSGGVDARAYHAAAVFTDTDQTSKMWVLGGSYSNNGTFYRGDVRKSADGVNWFQATSAAAFGPRRLMTALPFTDPADSKPKLWVLGGENGTAVSDTVYSSEDGTTWTAVTNNLPPIYQHSSVVFNDPANSNAATMWVFGGKYSTSSVSDDIYKSVDGVNWTLATGSAPFGPRSGATLIHRGDKLWLIGGADASGAAKSDAWYSANGVAWTQVTGNLPPTTNRPGVSYDGKLWVFTGAQSYFSYDGIGWAPVAATGAGMALRNGHAALAFADKVWVLAGADGSSGAPKTDAYYTN